MAVRVDLPNLGGAIGQDVRRAADAESRRIVLTLLKDVVLGTPRDTGLAQGNWLVSEDSPNTEITDRVSTDGSGSNVVAEEAGNISPKNRLGKRYIANNLPYIVSLEEGSSDQAPNGFIAIALAALEAE